MQIVSRLIRDRVKNILCITLKIWLSLIPKKQFSGKNIHNILFISMKPLRIGDLLMTTPTFRAVREKYKDSKITLLTDKTFPNRNKLFDEVKVVSLISAWSQRKNLRNDHDLVILPQKNLLQSFLALSLKANYITGFIHSWGQYAKNYANIIRGIIDETD